MALPAVEISNFRSRVNGLTDALRGLDGALAIIEDFGADDAARAAFFQDHFGVGTDHPDLDWTVFATGIVALRAMRTAWAANRLAIVKLRR